MQSEDNNAHQTDPKLETPAIEQVQTHPKAAHSLSKTGRQLRMFATLITIALIVGFLVVHHLKAKDQADLAIAKC